MSELNFLENLTELSVLNKLQKYYKFEMSQFCNFGDIAAIALEQGYRVKGNGNGGSVNEHYFGFGAITSVIISTLLMLKLDEPHATPIPVGFDNIGAPKRKGAIAKQFPSFIPEGKTEEQADADVVKAYFDMETKKQEYGEDFKEWEIPTVPAKLLLKRSRRNIDIDWSVVPEQFYLCVSGNEDDLQLMREICEDDKIPFQVSAKHFYLTNISRGVFPPLAEHLFNYDLSKRVGKVGGDDSKGSVKEVRAVIKETTPVSTTLPNVWKVLNDVPSVATYGEAIASVELKKAVAANKRKMGTNKHRVTSKLLDSWDYDEGKTVAEFLALCAEYYKEPEMQAKLFLAIISHLRVEGDELYRRQL